MGHPSGGDKDKLSNKPAARPPKRPSPRWPITAAGVGVLGVGLAIGTWWIWRQTGPTRTLREVAKAIERRDPTSFEVLVDLERFTPDAAAFLEGYQRAALLKKAAFEEDPDRTSVRDSLERAVRNTPVSLTARMRASV